MVQMWQGDFPPLFDLLTANADLAEQFGNLRGRNDEDGTVFCVSVNSQFQIWPALFVAQRYSPDGGGFNPGVLIVPETRLVLIGAGERLLAYELNGLERLWEDATNFGFWWWDRQGEVILMAAELELAAWNLNGQKLWSMFVEPPWSYSVQNGVIQLDVMDNLSSFPLATGPTKETP